MNYFFVSQRNQTVENGMKKLTAPDDKSHSYIKEYVRQNDLIVQYNSETLCITGVAKAVKDPYVLSDRIYVEIEIYNFIKPLKKDVWVKTMRVKQDGLKTPVNENYGINSRYLQRMNLPSFNYVLDEAEKNDADKNVVNIIRKMIPEGIIPDIYPDPISDKFEIIQKIFFGAPGTGKSFKVNSILPNEDIWSVSGEIRKQLFLDSDTAKKAHYAEVLDNKEKFGDIWNVGELSVLEEKLSEVNSVDNVSNPEHSALQAYIKFLKEYKFERVFRTTFHPDYDYAQFVGAYKPKKEGNAITYSFVPQVFAKAYAAAWKQYFAAGNASTADNQVFLVIEEINRGNCAQIFGDIFQLLDRDSEGFSQYSIDADCDFAEWLKENGIGDGKLKLPPNLNILATMNTSDQSLFPMDSAFKRRFDWEYVPIKYAKDSDCGDDWKADEFKIVIGNSTYMWLDFLKKVNADIYDATQSEDKQMGEFFIKPKRDDLKITFDEFRSKVLFYLWDSVYKDETERQSVFHFSYGEGDEKINSVTFQSLFGKDAEAIVNKIMENLKVEKVTA